MVENDIFTSKVQKISNGQSKSAVSSLITLERSQKLDLLSHLITNLRQSLIVCGPAGIGKTTLLNVLMERSSPDWQCCFIQGSHQFSFENILEQLESFLKKDTSDLKSQNLSSSLIHLNQRNQKLVLIIDEAGSLVPGLIDALNKYSLANPSLRIIFALTQDELYVKNSSDRTVEDCHFIELPPLSEKQCGEFLQNLSGKPGAPVSFNAIDDNMIAHLYQETHGIPGRIMMELPHLPEYGQASAVKWMPVLLPVLVVMAGLIYWSLDEDVSTPVTERKQMSQLSPAITRVELPPQKTLLNERPKAMTRTEFEAGAGNKPVGDAVSGTNAAKVSIDESNPGPGKAAVPAVNEAIATNAQAKQVNQNSVTESVPSLPVQPEEKHGNVKESSKNAIGTELKPVVSVVPSNVHSEPSQAAKPEEQIEPVQSKASLETDDKPWLYKQSPAHYTLQLIALSNRQSLMDLMNKYSSLKSQFKYIKTVSNRKEKYILLYGSFASYAAAGSAMQKLPVQFRKSWIRRFKVLQNDIKNAK